MVLKYKMRGPSEIHRQTAVKCGFFINCSEGGFSRRKCMYFDKNNHKYEIHTKKKKSIFTLTIFLQLKNEILVLLY